MGVKLGLVMYIVTYRYSRNNWCGEEKGGGGIELGLEVEHRVGNVR